MVYPDSTYHCRDIPFWSETLDMWCVNRIFFHKSHDLHEFQKKNHPEREEWQQAYCLHNFKQCSVDCLLKCKTTLDFFLQKHVYTICQTPVLWHKCLNKLQIYNISETSCCKSKEWPENSLTFQAVAVYSQREHHDHKCHSYAHA